MDGSQELAKFASALLQTGGIGGILSLVVVFLLKQIDSRYSREREDSSKREFALGEIISEHVKYQRDMTSNAIRHIEQSTLVMKRLERVLLAKPCIRGEAFDSDEGGG